MEIKNRNLVFNQRGNIDGITPRRPMQPNQAGNNAPQKLPDEQQSTPTELSEKPPEKKPKNKPPKKRGSLLIIILALIILSGLSALAIYVGLQKNKADTNSSQQIQNKETNNKESAASAQDLVDQTIKQIDELNDQSDSSGEGLSDEKLGL